ncbi:hypothetical protein [Streptomyces sp. ISL-100]|nr:hypothetical protein [Streptomyces sp. ISL-100]MBT2401209.1 hypothetical protein [Streptomyces sp. ISL-100]
MIRQSNTACNAVALYVDRRALAQQIAGEEEQRRALADFLGWLGRGG